VALTKSPENDPETPQRAQHVRQHPAADECWMLVGRLPTVALRMNRQSKNAQRLAEALNGHPKPTRVLYPTLFTDP